MERENQIGIPAHTASETLSQKRTPQKTYEFLQAVFSSRAVLDILESAAEREIENVVQELRFVRDYYFSDEQTYRELGRANAITGQAAHQKVKKGLGRLWEASSPEIKQRFGSYENAVQGKPTWRARTERPPKKITQAVINEILAIKLERAETDEEIQDVLDQTGFNFNRRYSKGKQPLLVSGRQVVLAAGVHYLAPMFSIIDAWRKRGIPCRVYTKNYKDKSGEDKTQQYFAVVARHFDRAAAALIENADIPKRERPSVAQVCGPRIDIPNTNYIMTHFYHPAYICAEEGIRLGGSSGVSMKTLIGNGCNVPILRYEDSKYLVPPDQKEAFREFVRRRKKELGL